MNEVEEPWGVDPDRFRRVQLKLLGQAAVEEFVRKRRSLANWKKYERASRIDLGMARHKYHYEEEAAFPGWQERVEYASLRIEEVQQQLERRSENVRETREELRRLAAPVLERMRIEDEGSSAHALRGGAL
ncbi:hypothetical protein [Arthrobacter mobilis]|uniref:Uncharacterized protein n=1 Tax=Arthrobacter mobilis TaxID=2724944 RepID=A0A7X6K6T3_9MICC|nr:hypothetical protein [Arthrobacter mobilis]NKX55925.1 hypothetical protein [Arthrobacter mobilis]